MNNKVPVLFLIAIVMMPLPAFAYMGPGAGITAIGCLLALLAGIWYTFKGFLWLPLKRMLGKTDQADTELTQKVQTAQPESDNNPQPQAAAKEASDSK